MCSRSMRCGSQSDYNTATQIVRNVPRSFALPQVSARSAQHHCTRAALGPVPIKLRRQSHCVGRQLRQMKLEREEAEV